MAQSGRIRVGDTPAQSSKRTYRFGRDFDPISTTVSLDSDGRHQTVAELDIADGTAEWVGRGRSNNPLQAQGFVGIRLVNDTAAGKLSGSYRISVRTAQGRRLYNLHEGDLESEDLFDGSAGSGTKLSRKDREPLPSASNQWETQPRILSVDVVPDSDFTVDFGESETQLRADGYRAEALR